MSHPDSITTIDCQYMSPMQVASYLLVDEGRAAFVDNNTNNAVPLLLKALEEQGLGPEDVEQAIVTHIHLDHAGGTGKLVEACPNATVLAHPNAVRHLVDPERLVKSSRRVFGETIFDELFGEVQPVPEDRIRSVADGEVIKLGNRDLKYTHTRGHAEHHFIIHDLETNSLFTGDMFGLSYPPLQRGSRPYVVVVCPPPEFDPQAWRETVNVIVDAGADRLYPTHFGVCEKDVIEPGAEELLRTIDTMEAIMDEVANNDLEGDALTEFCEARVRESITQELERCGVPMDADTEYYGYLEVGLNTQGVAYHGRKRREAVA